MEKLTQNWITEKHIDFEFKKYVLLAYLSGVNSNFEKTRLYPYFNEIIQHYKNLISVKENKKLIADAFPSKLQKIDLELLNMEYEKIINDDNIMAEIEQIINYSIPQFEHYLNEGRKIYDFVEEQLHISPIGVVPLNADYGYLFLKDGGGKSTRVYEYQMTIFEGPEDKYRGIHTQYLESYAKNFTTTYEFIKADLIKKKREMPNPATYVIETDLILPLNETFLPIAKRILVRYLGS